MYKNRLPHRAKPANRRAFLWIIPLITVVFGGLVWLLRPEPQPPLDSSAGTVTAPDEAGASQPLPPLVNLQPVVDEWLTGQTADYGIVVYDPLHEQVIAAHQPDKQYFAASLYKLFVAYLALADFQSGAQNPDEILTGDLTRKECVDKMIRESHSPCGEAMLAAMGQEELRARLAGMGIHNTIFAGIATTAQDSATILRYILEMRDLSAENAAFLRQALREAEPQYRQGLPRGAPEATWETKVGWNQQHNYHDAGIITLPGGREYVIALFSQNNGSPTPITDFAATIYDSLHAE